MLHWLSCRGYWVLVGGVVGTKKDLKNAAVDVLGDPGGGYVGKKVGKLASEGLDKAIRKIDKALPSLAQGKPNATKLLGQKAAIESEKKGRTFIVEKTAAVGTSIAGDKTKEAIQ